MIRYTAIIVVMLAFSLGCARLSVQAPEKPIKVDVSMRLDIYQHIEKDIDSVESIVSGSKDKQGFLDCLITSAYAQGEGLSPEVEQAALRRKARRAEFSVWQAKGAIGENKAGLLEIRNSQESNPTVEALVKEENSDRMTIYAAIAQKNSSTVAEVQKIYVKKYLHPDAPSGTPIEVLNEATGTYEWKTK